MRRQFLAALILGGLLTPWLSAAEPERPNVLWISAEDISPDLGCYGDEYATTPNLDALAARGIRFSNAFSHAGVCAPSRSGLITGMYPPTIGSQHMRCQTKLPPEVTCFTAYLREAGYFCTNNSKTDYQFAPPRNAWDMNNDQAHWRKRRPKQPFFAVFNFTSTHESQIRSGGAAWSKLDPKLRHDPAKAKLPPYYPDTPVVRTDWARYYDNVTAMDQQITRVLKDLEADGLAEDTIIWFWGDHGRGLPRGKRWIYDSGLKVPLIVYVPPKWREKLAPKNPESLAGGVVNEDLVAFVDFAPTMLALAGVEIPAHLQGQVFFGKQQAAPREYIYAHRDRMDERSDLIRAVRDKRYKYIRNYLPQVTRGQSINYMDQMPTMREMRRLFAAGKLQGPELQYFEPTKPLEELYDTQIDPHEIHNLAADPGHQEILARLRQMHLDFMRTSGDTGLLPESELAQLQRSPDWRKELDTSGLLERLLALRMLDGQGATATAAYLKALDDPAAAMRYWAVIGLVTANDLPAGELESHLTQALNEPAACVRIAAARALCQRGQLDEGLPVLEKQLTTGEPTERLLAAQALDDLGPAARPALPSLKAARQDKSEYVRRVADHAVSRWGEK